MSNQKLLTAVRVLFMMLAFKLGPHSSTFAQGSPPPTTPPLPTQRAGTDNPRQQAFLRFMEARRLKAEALRRREDKLIDQAIEAYRDTIWLDPQAAEPRVDLGELYLFAKGDQRSAEREAVEAIKRDANCVGAHLLLARLSIAVIKLENQSQQQVATQLERAAREYETVVKLDSNSAEAWALLAELYGMKNDAANQLHALERWASAPLPSEQNFYYWLANSELTPDRAFAQLSQAYLRQSRNREALDAARRAYEFDPENNEYGRNLILAIRAANKIGEELKLYARLSKTAPSAALEIGYATALIRAGKYAEAVEKLRERVKGENANTSLIELLATAQRRGGQRAAAADTLKAGLTRAEANARPGFMLELADTYEELGRNDEALAQYEQLYEALIAKGPVNDQTSGLFNHVVGKMARLLRRSGNQARLQALLTRARRSLDEQNPLIESLTIESLREEGKRREALELTRATIRRAPEDRSLRLTEVLILSELKSYQESTDLLRGMLTGQSERAAEDANVYLILSNVQMQASQFKDAEASARKALELNPGDGDALLQLSSVLDRAGQHEESEKLLRDLLEREPDNATVLNNLGYFLVERGQRLPEALALIERAVAIEPLNGSFLDSLGWTQYKLGNAEKARASIWKKRSCNPAAILPCTNIWAMCCTNSASWPKPAAPGKRRWNTP
ncbi:MAG: tetratricopeptide repeat protein [Acidobacteria bacterium]|nr:tetratricopeptide repeat protein [Acidobacteriota bacterium]